MPAPEKHIAAHPISGVPYDKIEFFSFSGTGAPLYKVKGLDEPATSASKALRKAFAKYGGKCFYCAAKFKPQALSREMAGAHRDHIMPQSQGGTQVLHNMVIACGKCGSTKANHPIHEFRPKSAGEYLEALSRHISDCVKGARS